MLFRFIFISIIISRVVVLLVLFLLLVLFIRNGKFQAAFKIT